MQIQGRYLIVHHNRVKNHPLLFMKRHPTPLSYFQYNHVQCAQIPDGQPVVSMARAIPVDRNLTTSEGFSPFLFFYCYMGTSKLAGRCCAIDTYMHNGDKWSTPRYACASSHLSTNN